MFREIRRQDRVLTNEEAMSVLAKGEYGVLSMVTDDGYGYGVPMSYTIWEDKVYFHCALKGAKIDYLKANNKVSFTVVGMTKVLPSAFSTLYESVILFGKAVEVVDQEKHSALIAVLEKYAPNHVEIGLEYIEEAADKARMFRIDIEHISGKGRKTEKDAFKPFAGQETDIKYPT